MVDLDHALAAALEAFGAAYDAWTAHPDDPAVEQRYLAAHRAVVAARLALLDAKENAHDARPTHD